MAFLPKVFAVALGIATYEVALRPIVAGRRGPSSKDQDEQEDDFSDEDWESEPED